MSRDAGTTGTVGAWFARRSAAAPPRLRERMRASLGDAMDCPARETSRCCGNAAYDLVHGLFSSERAGRDAAIDLLAADALVTYALEFAADDPEQFTGVALDVMRHFGHLVESGE